MKRQSMLLSSLLLVSAAAFGQAVTPSTGATVNPTVTPSQGVVIDPSVTPSNAAQPTNQGVFGPSRGPGIFGNTSGVSQGQVQAQPQPDPVGIYINQAGTPSNTTQNQQQTLRPGSNTQTPRPGQDIQATSSTDAFGNPLPSSDSNVRSLNPSTRDLQPLTTDPNPSTPIPAGSASPSSVTGR